MAGNKTKNPILGNEYQVKEKTDPRNIGSRKGKNRVNLHFRLKQNWRWALAVLVVITLLVLMDIFHMRFNFTPSMPIGFYYQVANPEKLQRGQTVEVCLPKVIGEEGLQRGYLNKGYCEGGFEPVIKELIAIPGDTVQIPQEGILVNQIFYYAPFIKFDMHGNAMSSYPVKQIKNTNQYWLYGANDPEYSWDSRFYGGVDRANIQGAIWPFITTQTFSNWFESMAHFFQKTP